MSEHWYKRTGEPSYEIESKGGGLRAVTLRDARNLGLVPSVTTVLNVIDKPALTNWKVDQGILAALTLPRIDGEDEPTYLARIKSDGAQQAKDAASEGTRIHDAIERSFKGLVVEDRYLPHIAGVRAELAKLFPGVDDWVCEESFGHRSGFGGKVDLHSPSTGIVVDHKGKDCAPGDTKRLAYDQHYQLAAYHTGLELPLSKCANLFVSRSHPGHVVGHVWSEDEIMQGWQVFHAALQLWKAIKKFDPSF